VVALRLPGVDGIEGLGPRMADHVATCLSCQAEAARYRSLRRRLGELDRVTYTVPDSFTNVVMSRLADPVGTVRSGGRRLVPSPALVAATAAAAVATAGTVVVLLRRLQATV
jgi:hypothetical protein